MLFRALERVFVFLLLLSSMNVVIAMTPDRQQQSRSQMLSGDVDVASVIVEGAVYTLGAILVWTRWRRVLRAARQVWPLLLLVGIAFLSTTWSIQPMITFRRSLSLFISTAIAIYLGERYSIKEFARLLAEVLCFVIAAVLALYFVAPDFVIDHSYGGAWKGLSSYKNTFGEHMALAIVALYFVRFHRFRWTRYLFLFSAVVLLVLSHSATALVCCIVAVAAIPLWRFWRGGQSSPIYLVPAIVFCTAVVWGMVNPGPILQALGRDATLTGRTRLWAVLIEEIGKRPLLGYGYASFWSVVTGNLLNVWARAGWMAPIADNGYIDLVLSLGLFGATAFFFVFIGSFRNAIHYFKYTREAIGVWPVTYLCLFALNSICESELLARGNLPFIVFATITTSLALSKATAQSNAKRVPLDEAEVIATAA